MKNSFQNNQLSIVMQVNTLLNTMLIYGAMTIALLIFQDMPDIDTTVE